MSSFYSCFLFLIILGICFLGFACGSAPGSKKKVMPKKVALHSAPSTLVNQYVDFHAPEAINKMVAIENDYFLDYGKDTSRYYGTEWAKQMKRNKQEEILRQYLNNGSEKRDSLHCTLYAMEGLKAGFGERFGELDTQHRQIWRDREYAGWSIGYLLVKHWGWKAYLVLDRQSQEYDQCMKAYQKTQSYPVWRQPDIPLEDLFVLGDDDEKIKDLLKENEFGWGFSHQGIHTWVTRFQEVKECNWLGAPVKEWDISGKPLFINTTFLEYRDYASHLIVFPRKR